MKTQAYPNHADPARRGTRLVPVTLQDRALLYAVIRAKADDLHFNCWDEPRDVERLKITMSVDSADHWDDTGCYRAVLTIDSDADDVPAIQAELYLWVEMVERTDYVEPAVNWSLRDFDQSNVLPFLPVIHSNEVLRPFVAS